jgi:hypothetical protein
LGWKYTIDLNAGLQMVVESEFGKKLSVSYQDEDGPTGHSERRKI